MKHAEPGMHFDQSLRRMRNHHVPLTGIALSLSLLLGLGADSASRY